MKRYLQFLTVMLSAGALFVACNSESNPELAGGKEIRFSAAIGQYQSKAGDTAFDEGDAIGLFAEEPVSAENARLEWTGNALTPESPILWGKYQLLDEDVRFFAYYPYAADGAKQFVFSVPADQSSEEAFTAADLMLASTVASPMDESVMLHFTHRMVRLVMVPDNRMDAEIVEATFSGAVLSADVDITVPSVALQANAQAQPVKAAPVADSDGNKAWSVIIPAQTIPTLSISVLMSDGKEYVLEANNVVLQEGRSYTANVIFDAAMSPLEFTADIADWIDDWGYIGKDHDPGKLPVTWTISFYGNEYPMEELENGLWHVLVPEFFGQGEFQVIKENNYSNNSIPWRQYYGVNVPDYNMFTVADDENLELALSPDAIIYLASEAPVLEFWLDPKARKLTVGTHEYNWESIGYGKMVETALAGHFEVPKQELDVEFFKDPALPNVYRIAQPYRNWVCPEGFTYSRGDDLLLFIRDDYYVHFNYTRTGVSTSDTGMLSISSSNGYLYPEDGFMYFWSVDVMYADQWSTISGSRLYMYVTLPGGTRPLDTSLQVSFEGIKDVAGADGVLTKAAQLGIYAGMDIEEVRGGLYSGHYSATDIRSLAGELITAGDVIDFENQCWVELRIPVTQTGTYTYVIVGKGSDGKWTYASAYYSALLEEEAPAASITVSAAAGLFAEQEIVAHVNFENPQSLWALAVEKSLWDGSEYTDDDIYDLVLSYGTAQSVAYLGADGMDITLRNLKSATPYYIFVAGISAFDMSAWAKCEASTGTAPNFTSFGTGHYHDNWMNAFGEDGWHTEVEIMKADTEPVRYRAMAPYDAFWEKHANAEYCYGESAPWIDFCIVDNDIHYLPYLNGYLEPEFGPVQYSCTNSRSGNFYPYNTMIQEGVYNIAPGAYILGTNYWYDLTNTVAVIYLEMPGYTLTLEGEEPAHAPRMSRSSGEAAAPLTELRPLTRHMLHTGEIKVTVREQ